MKYNEFKEVLETYNIEISENQYEKFLKYFEILIAENQKYNLTAITEVNEVFIKHFLDSVLCMNYAAISGKILDIGSGAGFPSIPLKILIPELEVVIIDALQKRITFLNYLVNQLEMKDVVLIHARAEEKIVDYRETFDFVTARAVANMQILSELCIPYLKVSGKFIVLKGSSGYEEVASASSALKKLGCELEVDQKYNLINDMGERTCFVFKKVKQTPKKYPRNFGQIKKSPL